jgi:hypothetical protein
VVEVNLEVIFDYLMLEQLMEEVVMEEEVIEIQLGPIWEEGLLNYDYL